MFCDTGVATLNLIIIFFFRENFISYPVFFGVAAPTFNSFTMEAAII